MRRCVLATLVLASCSSRPDSPLDAAPPAPEAIACNDVAAATLWLGDATPSPVEACEAGVIAVSMSQTHTWTLDGEALHSGDTTIALGDVTAADVAAGYGATAFVLDGSAGAIHRAEGTALTAFAKDTALGGARAVVRIGGSLFVGTPSSLLRVSLSDAAVSVVRDGLDVLDVTVDDVGALVVLQPTGLARLLPSGDDAPLAETALDARRIAFDLGSRTLLAVDAAGQVQRMDYGAFVPEAPTHHGEMGPFERSGFILAGAEYWPHRGSTPAAYPEEILWGFYPHEGEVFEGSPAVATATEAATKCAEASFAALQAWIPTATEALTAATDHGKAPRFYLWVNDYSEADDPFPAEMRQAKLWYWARNPAVAGRIPGYFKWETVLDQKGECHWPEPTQAMAFLKEAAAE